MSSQLCSGKLQFLLTILFLFLLVLFEDVANFNLSISKTAHIITYKVTQATAAISSAPTLLAMLNDGASNPTPIWEAGTRTSLKSKTNNRELDMVAVGECSLGRFWDDINLKRRFEEKCGYWTNLVEKWQEKIGNDEAPILRAFQERSGTGVSFVVSR